MAKGPCNGLSYSPENHFTCEWFVILITAGYLGPMLTVVGRPRQPPFHCILIFAFPLPFPSSPASPQRVLALAEPQGTLRWFAALLAVS